MLSQKDQKKIRLKLKSIYGSHLSEIEVSDCCEEITKVINKFNKKRSKKQKIVSLKEIKLRPGTDTHDYNFKIKNAKKFITKGDKVKFTVKFKGREMQHTELGKELMTKIIEETKDIAKVESKPKFEGRQMVMIIQPI